MITLHKLIADEIKDLLSKNKPLLLNDDEYIEYLSIMLASGLVHKIEHYMLVRDKEYLDEV